MKALSGKSSDIAALLGLRFPSARFCLWNTAVFDELLPHPLDKPFDVVELERGTKEEAFRFLSMKVACCIREEDFRAMRRSLPGLWQVTLVRNLTTEAPLSEEAGVSVPSGEKLFVDLFCDDGVFHFIEGNSLEDAMARGLERFSLRKDTLLRYAARRGRRAQLLQYLRLLPGNKFDDLP